MYKIIKLFMFAMLALALTALSTTIFAKYKPNKCSICKEAKHYPQQANPQDLGLHFSAGDRKTILDYFHNNPYQYSALPPGIAKNLARGKPLPPGIAKRYIPSDLATLLNTNPDYEYLMIGSSVAMIAKATGIIADIISE